jgi:SAM-dependent methyltransferase
MTEFDDYHNNYEATIGEAISYTGKPQAFFTKVKAQYLLDLYAATFGATQTLNILDIGCGVGSIHEFLLQDRPNLRIWGADVAHTVIERARVLRPQVQYDCYDGLTLPYERGHFDACLAICVLHHVPQRDWAMLLQNMRDVVKPGGIVTIIEHNPYNPLTQHLVRTCPFDRNARLLRLKTLMSLFRDIGLDQIAHRYFQFTPFGGSLFQRFDRALGWLPLGAQYFVSGRNPL